MGVLWSASLAWIPPQMLDFDKCFFSGWDPKSLTSIFRRTCLFFVGLACLCHVCCPPRHHTPIHKGIHKGGRREAPPPFVEAARSAASFMDGCVGAGEAADAAETHVNVRNTCTCTCMHTLRATFAPHGHHGRAQSAGRPNTAFWGVV